MAFPNDAWISDPVNGQLYKVTNGMVDIPKTTREGANSVLVSQREGWVFETRSDGYVNVVKNGIWQAEIEVGALPVAMCEDSSGTLYVANYADNTVSKITNPTSTPQGAAGYNVKTFAVPSGPRDLVCDSRNRVFVACYNVNKVAMIANDTVVDSIEVGLAPRAITCDIGDNIWVANYGSGTISKISKSVKVLDIPLGTLNRGAVAIVTDSTGVIYTANYLGNDVSMIKMNDSTQTYSVTNIPVDLGPIAIGVDRENTVMVLSESTGTLTYIKEGIVTDSIFINLNAIGFGDFTGCATYNVVQNVGATSSSPMPPYGMSHMDGEIQNLLNMVKNGEVSTSADKVSYTNIAYPTVQDALDKMLNVDPVVEDFEIVDNYNNMYEYGSVVSALDIKWKFSKPMVSAEVRAGSVTLATLGNGTDPVDMEGDTTITGFNLTINKDTTLAIIAYDENNTQAAIRVMGKLYVAHKIVYGGATYAVPTNEILQALSKSSLHTDPYGLYFKVNCGNTGNKVPFIAVPKAWNIAADQILIGGAQFTDGCVTKATVSNYVNSSQANLEYDVFYLDQDFSMSGVVLVQIINTKV